MKKLLAGIAQNSVFANILMLLILLSGFIASNSMIREEIPEMSLDMIMVNVSYPGADPEEVEEAISRKLEEALDGLEGIKDYTTTSSENSASATIEIKEGYDPDDVLEDVKTEIEAINTLPVDAERPIVKEVTFHRTVMNLYLTGDMSERRLKEWAETIKDEIQALPEVTLVDVYGTRDYEINIGISEEKLREYGLTFEQVSQVVANSNLNRPGGTLRSEGEELRIRTLGRKYTGEDLANVVVMASPEGDIVTLDRIAEIDDGFTEDPIISMVDGKRSVTITVSNSLEEDAIVIAKAVKKYVAEKKQQLPAGCEIGILSDNTEELKARITLLVKNGILGLGIVFLSLWAFLDFRVAFWSGMGIPISIAGGMMVLWACGGTLNMNSLFAFVMIMGIVVDDAIVVGEAIYVQRKNGESPLRSAVNGTAEVGLPVIAAVLTSVIAFLPLMNVGSVMGKFIFFLPIVVIGCLMTSLVECLTLLPAHLNHLPDFSHEGQHNGGRGRITPYFTRLNSIQKYTSIKMERFVEKIYMPFLEKSLTWRYISLCVAISIFMITIGFIRGGIIRYNMFPDTDGATLQATVQFPDGTPQTVTKEAVDKLLEALNQVAERTETASGKPLLVHTVASIGQSRGEGSGSNVGSVEAILLPAKDRGIHSSDISFQWEKEVGGIPGVESLTFSASSFGRPGSPIEIKVQGADMDMLLKSADDLMERLKEFDGVYQVQTDFSPGKNEMRLSLKPEARGYGLTVADLAKQVQSGYYGNEAVRILRGTDDIRVKVRYTEEERTAFSSLDSFRIRTADGHELPLMSVADITYEPGYSSITRTNRLRGIEVSAKLDYKTTNANEIMGELSMSFFPVLKAKYPGLTISVEGDQKHNREAFGSLAVGFPLALLGIFVIMATIFRSYVQPFIIMFTVPFGIIGAILGHLLLGYDLAMMSAFGMVALTGVVVNDAIVLIDRINRNLARGMPFFQAVRKGGARRFRAVFLTTVSTVGGLLPLMLETDFQAQTLVPMAIALAAGVSFATLLTLVLIPGLFTILNDIRMLIYKTKHGTWPTREEVEPASRPDRGLSEKETITGNEPVEIYDNI